MGAYVSFLQLSWGLQEKLSKIFFSWFEQCAVEVVWLLGTHNLCGLSARCPCTASVGELPTPDDLDDQIITQTAKERKREERPHRSSYFPLEKKRRFGSWEATCAIQLRVKEENEQENIWWKPKYGNANTGCIICGDHASSFSS